MIHMSEFDPSQVRSQKNFLDTFFTDILPRSEQETQVVILSGAMGSGKSLAVQFIIDVLCMRYNNLKCGIGRISIKDAQETFFRELKIMTPSEALKKDGAEELVFKTGSLVKCRGWGDGNVTKLRADNYHVFVMEEVTEDAGKIGTHLLNKKALQEIFGRVRNPNGPNIIFLLTNPDDPEHWLYSDYIMKAGYVDGIKTSSLNREDNYHLFYSVTSDNIHLKKSYMENLMKNLTEAEAQQKIYGKWVSISKDVIYYEYNETLHYFPQKVYTVNKSHPVYLSWDFNTGVGKPMSVVMFQFINDHFHFYDECIMEKANTKVVLEELAARGFFDGFGTQELIILGDAAGWGTQQASGLNDYDFMKMWIKNYELQKNIKINFKIRAAVKNPEVKARHKCANLFFKNLLNEIRFTIYAPAYDNKQVSSLHRGLKSTKLKKGAKEIEDDSNPMQHCTTAMGYGMWYCNESKYAHVQTLKF